MRRLLVGVGVIALVVAVFAVAMPESRQDRGQTKENPVRVGGDVPPLKRVKTILPSYPADAPTGGMILELTVTPTGEVDDVRVVRGLDGATDAAVSAARQWLFEPLVWEGRTVWAVASFAVSNPWQQ
jgi:TonB family protein